MAATIEELKAIESEMLKQLIEVNKSTREQANATPSKAAFRKEMSQVGGGSSPMPGPGSIAKQHFGALARMGGQKAAGWLSGHAPGSMGGGQGGMFAKLAAGAGGDGAAALGGGGKAMGGAGAGGAAKFAGGFGAVIALGKAAYDSVKKLKEWTQSLSDSNKMLAAFSPSMQGVGMYGEQREAMRKNQMGENLAPSAMRLEKANQDLGDALAPFEELGARIKNDIGAQLASGVAAAIEKLGLKEAAEDANKNWEKLFEEWQKDEGAQDFNQQFEKMAKESADRVHHGQIRRVDLRNNPPGGLHGKANRERR